MIYNKGEQKKDILLEINTITVEEEDDEDLLHSLEQLLRALDEERVEDFEEQLGSFLEEDEMRNEITLSTEATIETDPNGNIVISYNENEDDGRVAVVSRIVFDPAEPDLVAMSKEGAISTVLSFESGKTHICEYKTPYMPFKVYVMCNLVKNTLLYDGRLKLDYILDINESNPQHFYVSVRIKEAPEDILKDFLS